MTGTLSQLIALTTFGNDFLINNKLENNFYPGNTNFRFCNQVNFIGFKKSFFSFKKKAIVISDNPIEWFKYLKKDGCKKLRVFHEYSKDQSFAKDHKLAGFVGGGGTWLIEAVYENYSNYWSTNWSVTNQNAPDNKIWSVNYGLVLEKQSTSNLQIEQTKIKEELQNTLNRISEFAFKHNLKHWAEQFENAKAVLMSEKPNENYYLKDLIPLSNYSTLAQQILFSAGSAWVFGGMGSWNDLSFQVNDDNELYDSLSEELYLNINKAIISAVNSF